MVSDVLVVEHKKRVESITKNLSFNITPFVISDERVSVFEIINNFKQNESDISYIFVQNSEGLTIAHTFEDFVPSGLLAINSQDIKKYSYEEIMLEDDPVLDVAIPLTGGKAGLLRVGVSEKSLMRAIESVVSGYLVFQVVLLLVVILLVIFLTQKIVGPTVKLKKSVDKINKDGILEKIDLKTGDEIEELADSFYRTNKMLFDHRDNLEKKIKERTRDLEVAKTELEKNVTKLKEAKVELRQKIKRLEVTENTEIIIQSLNDAIVFFDLKKNIVLANPKARYYFGNIEKKQVSDIDNIIKSAQLEKEVDKILSSKEFDILNEVSFSNKIFRVFFGRVKDYSGKPIGGMIVFYDITILKQIDKVKNDFISIASHQLRTPLTSIKLFTEMMLDGQTGRLGKKQKEYLENITETSQKMNNTINQLMDITKMESGKVLLSPEDVDISEYFNLLISEMRPMSNKAGISILFENKMKKGTISVDKILLKQVIYNLISNAIIYTGKKKTPVEIKISDYGDKKFLIEIKDHGIGIPKEKQKMIFGKFFRAENAMKVDTDRSGLGLYLSKTIIEASGGKIWFESEIEKETTFYISLPKRGIKNNVSSMGIVIS